MRKSQKGAKSSDGSDIKAATETFVGRLETEDAIQGSRSRAFYISGCCIVLYLIEIMSTARLSTWYLLLP
jgi:hypothetical protein